MPFDPTNFAGPEFGPLGIRPTGGACWAEKGKPLRPDGAPIYVILDNLSAHKGPVIRNWARRNKVELCFTPTNASWANPIAADVGPFWQFTLTITQVA